MVLDKVPNVLGVLIVSKASGSFTETYREVLKDLTTDIDEMRHVTHGSTEGSSDTVVEWETQNGIHPSLLLPICRKVHVVGVDFSDTKDAGSTTESRPEITSDVLGSINSNTVNAELLDVFWDPSLQLGDDIGVFGIDIHER